MEDVTRRLRTSTDPDSVDRERWMAGNLFGDGMRDTDGRAVSEDEIRRIARRSIVAACTFWEEWDIAALTANVEIKPSEEDIPVAGTA